MPFGMFSRKFAQVVDLLRKSIRSCSGRDSERRVACRLKRGGCRRKADWYCWMRASYSLNHRLVSITRSPQQSTAMYRSGDAVAIHSSWDPAAAQRETEMSSQISTQVRARFCARFIIGEVPDQGSLIWPLQVS